MYNSIFLEKIAKIGAWFIDIPRTGSSSLRAELGQLHGDPYRKGNIMDPGFHGPSSIFADHMTAQEAIAVFGRPLWDSLYTFSLVRNPWDRMYSLFQYQRKIGLNIPLDMPYREYVAQLAEQKKKPESERTWYSRLLLSSYDYLFDESGKQLVSEIGRFEDRNSAITRFNKRLNPPLKGYLRLMETSTSNAPFQTFYDAETRDIIGELFKNDIQQFNYRFDDSSSIFAVGEAGEKDVLRRQERQKEQSEIRIVELLTSTRDLHKKIDAFLIEKNKSDEHLAQGIAQITQMLALTNQALDQIIQLSTQEQLELKNILREKESQSVALAQSVAREDMLSHQCQKLKEQIEEGPWRLRLLIRHPKKFFKLLWR
jgi:hypothetical protein